MWTRWVLFYMDDNMGAERDANFHQPVGELQQTREAELPALNFPLLFAHGEVGWHLELRYEGDASSHKNNRISCRNLLYADSGSRPVGNYCSIVLQVLFCAHYPH